MTPSHNFFLTIKIVSSIETQERQDKRHLQIFLFALIKILFNTTFESKIRYIFLPLRFDHYYLILIASDHTFYRSTPGWKRR